MTKIRNDILLQALNNTTGEGPAAGFNPAGRPIITIPLRGDEGAEVSKALGQAQKAASTVYEDIAVKTDAFMLRPEYIVQSVDVFHGAEIREVDPADWHGENGQVIRIHAAGAVPPTVVIADGEGRVIEQDVAARTDDGLWTYTTIAPATDGPRLFVTTRELPPHLMEVKFGE